MSALARWAYSFFTTTEVKVDNVATRELYCGEKTLFCSIVLTDSKGKAAFTNYHRNEIKVFSKHESVYNAKFELCINDDDQGRLDVYCVVATRAGRAQVKLDLGKWYTIVGQSEFPLVFQPSCPAKLTVTKGLGDQYVGGRDELQLASFDQYDNKAIACKHDIVIAGKPPGAVSLINSEISNGKYSVRLQFKMKCQLQVLIKLGLTGRRNNEDDCPETPLNRCIKTFPVNISHPPMSLAKSFCRIISPSDHIPIAGSPLKIEVEINDVFGKPIHVELMPTISASQNKDKILPSQICVRSTNSRNKRFLEIIETRAGSQLVRILLNDQIIPNWDFNVHVVASCPKYLRSLKVVCHPKDSEFKPVGNTLYYGAWATLEADITDEYGNVAKQITDTEHYEVLLEAFDNKDSRVLLKWKNAKINNGKICVEVQPKQVGQQQLILRLNDKSNPNESLASMTTAINVHNSPCSVSLTQVKFNDMSKCTAGSEYTFQVDIHDVFGNAVRPQSKLPCNIDVHILPQFLKHPEKQRGEYINKETDSTSPTINFTVAVGLKLAGLRNVKVVVNSDVLNSKIIPVEVVPSNPHHLNGVRFIAKTLQDPNFTPDPEVLYDNQWSTLEASIVDEYENVVTHFDGNEIIRLESAEQGNKTDVAYKDATINDGVLRVEVKAKGVGQRDILVILANKNRPIDEVLLQKLQRPVIDAPFSLNLSKISQLDTCIAGTQFKFQVFPFDVYGKAMRANSTAKCILSGKILDSPSPSTVNEECVMHENVEKSSNYCIDVTVVLTKAGERHLEIFDKDNKSKQICIKLKPDLDNVKCKQTTAKVTSVYTGDLSRLTTVFTDRFGNKIPLDAARPPRLFQKSGPKEGLQTKSDATAVTANTSSVDYQFLKQGTYVLSLQCPNLRGDYTDVEEMSVDVQKAPLDPRRCTVTWSPEFDDLEDQPLFTEDKQFKCVIQLKDIHKNNYIVDDEEAVDLSVTCGDKGATIQEKTILGPGALKATVPIINFQIHSGTTTEFCFIFNGHEIILRRTFIGYLNYDDSQCQIHSVHRGGDISTRTSAIECKNVTEREIRGEDNCHLENIRRICNSQDSGRTEVKQISCKVLVILPQKYPANGQEGGRNVLLHLVRALYYRQQASEADKEREKWKDRAKENYDRLKSTNKRGEKPTFCRKIKERYANLMRKYNRDACEEIFNFYNLKRDQNAIDLHGLLVTDEEKLKEHDMQLVMQGKPEDEVERIIEEEREEGDEAIRKLRQRLHETFDMAKAKKDRKTWLEVIVGAGHHSKVRGRQKIRPKVEKYLNEETGGFSVVNKGALVVTFEDYLGTGRCFGEYYCQRCQKAWKNGKSWKGKYQGCQGCYAENKTIEKCYPLKQRPLEGGSRYKSGQMGYTTGSHSAKFCEKCIELRYPCYK